MEWAVWGGKIKREEEQGGPTVELGHKKGLGFEIFFYFFKPFFQFAKLFAQKLDSLHGTW
jgi:hypothetical protein